MALREITDIKSKNNENDDKFQNLDAEIAIIGCLLWDNKNYEKISDFITEDHFTDENNRIIFKTIKNLLDKNALVSPITLKNHLKNTDTNFDSVDYLNKIKDASPSTQNTYQYAQLIYDLHIKRNLVGIGQKIIQETIGNEDNTEGINLIENFSSINTPFGLILLLSISLGIKDG